ncbi:hypothetical protein Q5M85_01685 [Paraclostridium bifermentans]|nr:hypothetical protein [Paraclostridium bifermentans]
MYFKDARSVLSLKILAYSLPFIGISSCLSGYFYGAREVVKSVSAEILEHLLMMAISIAAITIFVDTNIETYVTYMCRYGCR